MNTAAESVKKPWGGYREGAGRQPETLTRFRAWAQGRGMRTKDLALALEVSDVMARKLLAETVRPGRELAVKIERLTGGVFRPEYWDKVPKP